jgi:hypothetical protein
VRKRFAIFKQSIEWAIKQFIGVGEDEDRRYLLFVLLSNIANPQGFVAWLDATES